VPPGGLYITMAYGFVLGFGFDFDFFDAGIGMPPLRQYFFTV
jgi:asparagine N-glycosylation enzyme membrane subunit Stt3